MAVPTDYGYLEQMSWRQGLGGSDDSGDPMTFPVPQALSNEEEYLADENHWSRVEVWG
jgi:hypothetical protein